MKSTKIISKTVISLIISCIISFVLPANIAYAGYLIPPVPSFECVQCAGYYPKHHKHHRRHNPCRYSRHCVEQHDFVTFNANPAPANRGRWVNTDDCEWYDPDMATGDDDPTIYPGMNIDN